MQVKHLEDATLGSTDPNGMRLILARCTATLSEWITKANTAHGGSSPYPYGLYLLNGDPADLQDPPKELVEGPFLEVIPCDREDCRAAKLTWNETGTEAGFSFALQGATMSPWVTRSSGRRPGRSLRGSRRVRQRLPANWIKRRKMVR